MYAYTDTHIYTHAHVSVSISVYILKYQEAIRISPISINHHYIAVFSLIFVLTAFSKLEKPGSHYPQYTHFSA